MERAPRVTVGSDDAVYNLTEIFFSSGEMVWLELEAYEDIACFLVEAADEHFDFANWYRKYEGSDYALLETGQCAECGTVKT